MGLFDEMNLNPLTVADDSDTERKLPNDTSLVEDTIDTDKIKPEPVNTKNVKPSLGEIEVDVEEDTTNLPDNKNQATDTSTDVDEDQDKEIVKQWANYYKEINLLENLDVDTFEGTMEDLRDKVLEDSIDRINNGIEEYKSSVPQVVQDILAHWEDGADSDTLRRVVELKAEAIDLNKIDASTFKSDKETQKKVLTSYLQKTTRMTDAKIKKYVDQKEELLELEDEATEALTESKVLLKQEEEHIKASTKVTNENREKTILANQTKLKDTIKGTTEVITGIKLTDGEKKDIENLVFNPVGRYSNGQPQFYLNKLFEDDPIGMSVKLNYLASVTKGFTDWSKIEKKAVTTATKKVDSVFNTPPPKGKRTPVTTESGDWKENLRKFNVKSK